MSSQTKKRLMFGVLGAACLAVVIVAADYLGLFGIHEDSMTEFVEFKVKTLDAETGRKISDVKIRCFQYGTNNACAQPPSNERGVVRVSLLVEKHVCKSLLFTQKVWYSPIIEDELRIMYIHGDYHKPVQRYDIPELMENPEQIFTVELPPLISAAERARQRDESGEENNS